MKNCCTLLLALAFCLPLFCQQSRLVHFDAGAEFFPENYSEVLKSPAPLADEIVNGRYVRYLQCNEIPTAAERAVLEADGLQFLGYVSFGAYLVALPKDFDLKKLEKIGVRSIVSPKTVWKMAKNLREQPWGEWALHGDFLDVNVQVYPHVGIAQGAELCRRLGLTVLFEGNQNGFLQVRLPKSELEFVAALPWVHNLELVPPPAEPDDALGRSLHRSNLLDSDHILGKKYNGDGVSVLVRDDGPLGPHIDYQGRLFNLTESGDDGSHGDGVGGIFAGAGNLDPVQKGMAAGAAVYVVRYTPEFQDQTLPLHLNKNVTITNSSYSNGCNAGYTLAAQTVDRQIFEHPTLMHVFSAGNSNNLNTCLSYGAGNQWGNITGGHKMAKNAIATANTFADATLVNSSSRGPAYDGRLKPDISANGQNQVSTDPNNAYAPFGGTSGAAPGIAGCLAQLTQAFKTLNNGTQPESALLKAIILNTANDLGNPGPDFKFGWGHVNAGRALRLLEQNRWLEGQADQAVQKTHALQIPANVRQAKIMLYWAEAPASVAAAKALLNDLDLTLTAPDGTVHHPWKLDPTPDPGTLDSPAGLGRDSLNNVEQVAIENPAPGTWTAKINGTEVPFGPQPYLVLWEFWTDEVKITYPSGGEGLVPGEVERIHWDAYGDTGTFSLQYSTDDGFSWNQIADVGGDQRMFDWQVPNVVSGRVRLQIQRGFLNHVTEFPLSIAPVPTDIEVEKVCPTYMTISWKPAADTLPSDVYLLGKKYMEIVGTTVGNSFDIPLQNGGTEQWVSVRARSANGLAGRRAIAVQWPGELKNCVQPDDLGVRFISSPDGSAQLYCDAFTLPVQVELTNEGANPIVGAVLNYQVNSQPAVLQSVPTLLPGAVLPFTFQTPISVANNLQINLKIWSTYAPEDAFFNDTLRRSFVAVAQPANGYFTENFEGFDFPPFGWGVTNLDGGLTWVRSSQTVTGASGLPTRAVSLNSFFYFQSGEEDYLDLVPVDLSNLAKPGLTFEMAHAQRTNRSEMLRVEVYPACDLTAQPEIVWAKVDPELSTTDVASNFFSPNEATDWRKEAVSLEQFAGQKVIVRFVSTNDGGNNIFLDNIGIVEYNVTQPAAAISVASDTICPNDTIAFQAAPTGGDFTNYEWYFGVLSLPESDAFGPGPHLVYYPTPGTRTVRLIASNVIGVDTAFQSIKVLNSPLPNFTAQLSGLTVIFSNTSQNATSYFWDFGDGTTSTEVNPTHTYTAPGTYPVKLSATNQCKTISKSLNIPLTSTTDDLVARLGIRILPNPTTGDFQVEIESRVAERDVRLSLFDAQGRLIKEIGAALKQGFNSVSFENLSLPKGVYRLNVQTEKGALGFAVVVQ